ncbi:M67 family metallopeptidase [Allosphingosinicella flava]|uniref:M67 family metallopeptidase n=1 Tax=Allosphingosinicella flava TaxID=2771430 RepID=A0A7T2LMR0_9SPHN|nr:M67 family metallopeptidase [Sphingosinicella flava]QPQ55825.1 M67 family metallopeptidase [Sphingosinicella flava]
MGTGVKISRALLDRLRNEAAAAGPLEICGLLVGRVGQIEKTVASSNLAADPAQGFLLDPATQIAVQRRAREKGRTVLGCYHSHPSGDVRPSAKDAAQAEEEGALWLIVSRDAAALWIASKGGAVRGRFDAVALTFPSSPEPRLGDVRRKTALPPQARPANRDQDIPDRGPRHEIH